jgi:chemotaxis response regulator CheB
VAGVLLTGGRSQGPESHSRRRISDHPPDSSRSVVYGMPRAAAELGAAIKIMPVGNDRPGID